MTALQITQSTGLGAAMIVLKNSREVISHVRGKKRKYHT
jgi:translation initiation factor IF-1